MQLPSKRQREELAKPCSGVEDAAASEKIKSYRIKRGAYSLYVCTAEKETQTVQNETETQMIERIRNEISPILADAIKNFLAEGNTMDDVRKLLNAPLQLKNSDEWIARVIRPGQL